jgi:tetratricopeptide (TPR) repeat protein
MLRDNAFPDDNTRRWVLAKLLEIPPVLLGVQSLDDLLDLQQPGTRTQGGSHALLRFDSTEFRRTLAAYYKRLRFFSNVDLEADVAQRIAVLEQHSLYGPQEAKRSVATLLCGYHRLSSSIATDQCDFDKAIDHLNKAYVVAKERELLQLKAACLLQRGWTLNERGEVKAMQHDVEGALLDFAHATNDFLLACKQAQRSPAAMQGPLLASLGQVSANTAKDPQEFHLAIKKLEEAEAFIGKGGDEEDIHFIQLDEERYYLDRAAAYLASCNLLACYPRDARRELRNALAAAPTPLPKRRYAYNMILQATSSVIEGRGHLAKKRLASADDCFGEATQKATEALVLVKDIQSQVNVARIEKLCTDLRATPFGKENVDVARLEVEITAAKFPHLFP